MSRAEVAPGCWRAGKKKLGRRKYLEVAVTEVGRYLSSENIMKKKREKVHPRMNKSVEQELNLSRS